ncbi:MAG: hypothetical protein FD167_2304, partial [bacterium]
VKICQDERQAKVDKKVIVKEKIRLEKKQDKASKRIYKAKHN